jgi:predicted enzyme related to lactoylglutathione lyase
MDMGPIGIYLIFGYNGEQKGGMYIKPPDMPAPPHWLPYCLVPSVDALVETITSGGGKVLMPPMDVPGGGRITVLSDPAGAAFALHSCQGSASAETPKTAGEPKAKAKPAKSPPRKKPQTKAKAKSKPKVKAKAKGKAKVKAKAKSGSAARRKAPARKKPRAKSKSKAKARPKKARPAPKKAVRRKK